MTPKLVRTTKPALTGQHPGLRGDCSDLSGDCSGLRGDCSGLSGDCSGLSGDLDACGITVEDRAKGVGIASLIAP